MNLLKWFKKKKADEPKILFGIEINLCNDGNLQILYSWSDNTTSIAELTGNLLYQINNGNLKNMFLEILGEFAATKLENKHFVTQIIKQMEALEEDEDEPLIQPIQTLRMYE